jgi:pyruvate-formate lyase-activating enzyme
MKIVNLITETYQEYEDHLSIVLFCFGCNLSCSWCYSYNYVTDPDNILPQTAEQLIDEHYHPLIDGLVFLGGEPTIYGAGELKRIALYAKEKYKLDIKLFTNGMNPEVVLAGLREGWLDAVSIDYKCVTDCSFLGTPPRPYHTTLTELLSSLKGYEDKVEVRTTLHEGLSEEDVESIVKFCERLGLTHIAQKEF